MATATFIEKDQNWQDQTAIYWFELIGEDYGTGIEFEGETFGIAESGGASRVLDCDGCPLTNGHEELAVRRCAKVTDDLRAA